MMKLMLKQSLPLILLSFIAVSVSANESKNDYSGWYIGGSVGQINAKTELDLKNTNESDADASSLGIYGGLNFNENIGLEAAIIVNGDVSDKDMYGTRGEYDASVSSISLTPKLTWQMADAFSLYAKWGISIVSYAEDYDDSLIQKEDQLVWSGIGGTAEIGAQISITKHIHIRTSIDHTIADLNAQEDDNDYYNSATGEIIDAPDIEISLTRASIGLHYQF